MVEARQSHPKAAAAASADGPDSPHDARRAVPGPTALALCSPPATLALPHTRPARAGGGAIGHHDTTAESGIDLYWLPLGAGGWFVRLNGRVYEAAHALVERRRPLDLYHSALEVRVPEGRYVIENSWPIPAADGALRGVIVEGAVASRRLARLRTFRYEVRRWRDGVIADADEAVESPRHLSSDSGQAHRLLDLVDDLPTPTWGRDELGSGEMWNSKVVARAGVDVHAIRPPHGGRAPGWRAGVECAARGTFVVP